MKSISFKDLRSESLTESRDSARSSEGFRTTTVAAVKAARMPMTTRSSIRVKDFRPEKNEGSKSGIL